MVGVPRAGKSNVLEDQLRRATKDFFHHLEWCEGQLQYQLTLGVTPESLQHSVLKARPQGGGATLDARDSVSGTRTSKDNWLVNFRRRVPKTPVTRINNLWVGDSPNGRALNWNTVKYIDSHMRVLAY